MLADAEQCARALTARFAPGERVAVWAPNIPEWVILEFAIALAGLVLVTVNPAFLVGETGIVRNAWYYETGDQPDVDEWLEACAALKSAA